MSYACGGVPLMLAVAAGVERRVRGDDGGDGARVDDDAGQRRPGGEGEAGSQAQGPETTCGAQEVRCLLYGCSEPHHFHLYCTFVVASFSADLCHAQASFSWSKLGVAELL
jgi:hypothetical protein